MLTKLETMFTEGEKLAKNFISTGDTFVCSGSMAQKKHISVGESDSPELRGVTFLWAASHLPPPNKKNPRGSHVSLSQCVG